MKYLDLGVYEEPEEFFDDTSFTEVTDEEIYDKRRWATCYSQVFKFVDGTFWEANWQRGATEYQDNGVEDLEVFQVEPYEVTETKYKVIN